MLGHPFIGLRVAGEAAAARLGARRAHGATMCCDEIDIVSYVQYDDGSNSYCMGGVRNMGLGLVMILITALMVFGVTIPMTVFGVRVLLMDRRAKENMDWIAGEEPERIPIWKRILAIIAALLGICGTGGTLWLLFVLVESVLGYMLW